MGPLSQEPPRASTHAMPRVSYPGGIKRAPPAAQKAQLLQQLRGKSIKANDSGTLLSSIEREPSWKLPVFRLEDTGGTPMLVVAENGTAPAEASEKLHQTPREAAFDAWLWDVCLEASKRHLDEAAASAEASGGALGPAGLHQNPAHEDPAPGAAPGLKEAAVGGLDLDKLAGEVEALVLQSCLGEKELADKKETLVSWLAEAASDEPSEVPAGGRMEKEHESTPPDSDSGGSPDAFGLHSPDTSSDEEGTTRPESGLKSPTEALGATVSDTSAISSTVSLGDTSSTTSHSTEVFSPEALAVPEYSELVVPGAESMGKGRVGFLARPAHTLVPPAPPRGHRPLETLVPPAPPRGLKPPEFSQRALPQPPNLQHQQKGPLSNAKPAQGPKKGLSASGSWLTVWANPLAAVASAASSAIETVEAALAIFADDEWGSGGGPPLSPCSQESTSSNEDEVMEGYSSMFPKKGRGGPRPGGPAANLLDGRRVGSRIRRGGTTVNKGDSWEEVLRKRKANRNLNKFLEQSRGSLVANRLHIPEVDGKEPLWKRRSFKALAPILLTNRRGPPRVGATNALSAATKVRKEAQTSSNPSPIWERRAVGPPTPLSMGRRRLSPAVAARLSAPGLVKQGA